MIIDTSALVAIVFGEPARGGLLAAVRSDPRRAMSAGSHLETGIVIDAKREPALTRMVDGLITSLRIEVVPFTDAQVRIARQAYRDYGKSSGHPAGLNIGNCFAYALAVETGEPLLFVGDYFTHTDVRAARPAS